MTTHTGARVGVSTYSLSRALGATYQDTPANPARTRREPSTPGTLTLLELPARIADAGIRSLEISHPHLPNRDASYLNELRSALDGAGVALFSVLIETGDITHPDNARRDLDWIAGWIETASQLGAQRARVIAGHAPYTPETLQRSRCGLEELAQRGSDLGVRVTTENWFDLLATPDAVHALMGSLEGRIGFNLDFGNWGGATKYDDLASIYPYAESCHAKCDFVAPYEANKDDFNRCLELSRAVNFAGPYTLIYNDGVGNDEWRGLAAERELVLPYL